MFTISGIMYTVENPKSDVIRFADSPTNVQTYPNGTTQQLIGQFGQTCPANKTKRKASWMYITCKSLSTFFVLQHTNKIQLKLRRKQIANILGRLSIFKKNRSLLLM